MGTSSSSSRVQELFFTTGGACNGAGVLVNSSIHFGIASASDGGELLCLCNEWSDGKADLFDTSQVSAGFVTSFSPRPPPLSLSCSNFRITEMVVWAVVLLAALLRGVQVARVAHDRYAQFKEHRAKSKHPEFTLRDVLNVFALRVLLLDLFTVVPIISAVACLKIAGHTIGTDGAVTVLYVAGVNFFQFGTVLFARREFHLLTEFLPEARSSAVRRTHDQLAALSTSVYVLGVLLPSLISLGLDKQLGPWDNHQYVCLIARNLLSASWCSLSFFTNYLVFRQFRTAVSSLLDDRCALALDKMKQSNKTLGLFYIGVILLMLVFSIPQLWGFQTYCYALVQIAGAGRHPGKVFRREAKDAAAASGTVIDNAQQQQEQQQQQRTSKNVQIAQLAVSPQQPSPPQLEDEAPQASPAPSLNHSSV